MNEAGQIDFWLTKVETARRTVHMARDERRQAKRSSLLEEEPRARRGRVVRLPTAAPTHVVIGGATILGGQDDERARTLPVAWGARGGIQAGGSGWSRPAPATITGGLSGGGPWGDNVGEGRGALGRARQLASGYQPAVIKVVSYAHGVARATATGQYVQREDVALETHDGRLLADREAVAEEIKAWSSNFAKRAESQDVTAIRLKLHGVLSGSEGRETYEKAIAAGFDGHRYAYRLDATPSGELEARLVVAMAGAARERFRVREPRVGTERERCTQRRLDARSEAAAKTRIEEAIEHLAHAMSIDPGAAGHGRDGIAYRLNKLVEKGAAIDDRGKAITNVADARIAAREWGRSLRSQSSRDTMHLILSAKAGTDVSALTDTARAFLHDRFMDHKFLFGVHTDRQADGHIHAHAIVAVKNEFGQKIHPNRDTFRQWRQVYAEHAQALGLKIVAISARERASSQSYGPKDKAIVEAAERQLPAREAPDRAYAADPANQRLIDKARQRIQTARMNPIRPPRSEADRRIVKESLAAWSIVIHERPESGFAKDMLERLTTAQTIGNILHTMEKRVGYLAKEDHGMAISSEQMAKDVRLMNEAVSRTMDLLDGETRQQFRQTSARYLETLANRTDLQRNKEREVRQLSRAEVGQIARINGDRLIERAQEVRLKQELEAHSAERLAERALEAERRQEERAKIDPESQQELRAERSIVAGSQQSIAQEVREAAAAVEAGRLLADHPAQALPQALKSIDELAKLRVEQEKILREMEAERAEVQSIKGQQMS
jgi:type IV secretion system T-DNA border endonuclease VirD2